MFELFMYVYSCNALSAHFFAVDRALKFYFMIMIIRKSNSMKWDQVTNWATSGTRYLLMSETGSQSL